MSVDKIKAKILSDARAEAEKIQQEIAGQVRQIKAQQKEAVAVIEKETQQEAKRRAEDRYKKDIATAELELRKNLLAEKQALIQKIFDQAMEHLAKFKGEEYERFLLDLLLKTVERGDEQVIFWSVSTTVNSPVGNSTSECLLPSVGDRDSSVFSVVVQCRLRLSF